MVDTAQDRLKWVDTHGHLFLIDEPVDAVLSRAESVKNAEDPPFFAGIGIMSPSDGAAGRSYTQCKGVWREQD